RTCRHCGAPLSALLADLGVSPVANDYLRAEALDGPEPFYPLAVYVCGDCKLAQLHDYLRADEVFREDYAYFSSYSTSWLAHAERYATQMTARFALAQGSRVVEVASNDGYLLQYFKSRNIQVLGVEPCASVARHAVEERGIPTRVCFFGAETAQKIRDDVGPADLMVANNVLAHVPDINDFVRGFALLLAPDGVATFEFPHLLQLMQHNEFDTVYHEHFSYISLLAAERVFARAGLRIFDVDQLSTHGGSLRLYACRTEAVHPEAEAVAEIRRLETDNRLGEMATYADFADRVKGVKRELLRLLIAEKENGARIVAYGAAAKGNTLLNYCGIGRDIIDYVVDRSPFKQGMFLPGTRIPIRSPEYMRTDKPDVVLILPWNLADEIQNQLSYVRDHGGRFITAIPYPRVF
ncbi:MAG: class I SAM-dependent methyltransferase, partial [Caulobacteraceae bacterium]